MEIYKHIPKQKFQVQICQACGKTKECTWHHIGLRRYSKDWIWLCIFNGVESGCHEKVHANPAWAYEQGLLVKHNIGYKITMKEKKTKTCPHNKTYFDVRLGYNKCGSCGQKMSEIKFGVKKSHEKKEAPESGRETPKMGQEIQDPRIKEAETLKRELTAVTLKIKKSAGDKELFEQLKVKKAEIKSKMLKLQNSYED